MIRVTAINNEDMWIDEKEVVMVGPLMDRGLRQLGRAVLYIVGLPPLPIKESVDDAAARVSEGITYAVVAEDSSDSDSGDGRSSGREEPRLVVAG